MHEFPGYQQMQTELEQAQRARLEGNEGMARVCARRAAGIVVGEFLVRNGISDPGPSAYDRLKCLCEIPNIPVEIRQVATHFLVRVTVEHNLPVEVDLIEEAHWLTKRLLIDSERG